jgi:uncharacterized lipoprotein
VDKREAAYVSPSRRKKAAVLVNSEQPLNNLLAEKLAEGLRSRGLEVGNSGTTNLTLAISTPRSRWKRRPSPMSPSPASACR